MMDKPEDYPDEYHRHLDECKRCRNNPLSQCPVGLSILLRATAKNFINEHPDLFEA